MDQRRRSRLFGPPLKRPAWTCRAEATCRRISWLDVPGCPPDNSRNGTAGTSMWMSIRSNSGPLILDMYRSICRARRSVTQVSAGLLSRVDGVFDGSAVKGVR